MSAALIQPAEVLRDADGWWTHPDIPDFEEGDREAYQSWKAAQRLETKSNWLESEPDDHPVFIRYFENEEAEAVKDWNPSAPEGEGWFMLWLCDTEDGPVCVWGRRVEGGAA